MFQYLVLINIPIELYDLSQGWKTYTTYILIIAIKQ